MKAILRKGMAACAALLMGANVMAQENVFVEKENIEFSRYFYFTPSEMMADKTSRLLLPIYEKIELNYSWGTQVQNCLLGFQIVNKDLEVEREIKFITAEEYNNTRLKISEQLDIDGKWVEISRETSPIWPEKFWYYSIDSRSETMGIISQTLFNDDDKYEAIVPVYGGEVIYQREDEGTRFIYKNYAITALKIIDENGTTLYTLEAGEGKHFSNNEEDCSIVRIADKTYIVLPIGNLIADGYDSWTDNIESWHWYEICKETNSINIVRETRAAMNIAPTIADRDAQITITLNDDNSNVARELVVTGVNGQLVGRRDIPAGENSVQIPASMLRSGMYNFTLQQKGQVVDNGKVIVK